VELTSGFGIGTRNSSRLPGGLIVVRATHEVTALFAKKLALS